MRTFQPLACCVHSPLQYRMPRCITKTDGNKNTQAVLVSAPGRSKMPTTGRRSAAGPHLGSASCRAPGRPRRCPAICDAVRPSADRILLGTQGLGLGLGGGLLHPPSCTGSGKWVRLTPGGGYNVVRGYSWFGQGSDEVVLQNTFLSCISGVAVFLQPFAGNWSLAYL